MTMQTYLAAFQTYLDIERHASPHTVRNYLSDLQQFLTFARTHTGRELSTPEAIDAPLIRAFLAAIHRQGAGHTTMARKLSCLRSFLQFLQRQGHLSHNAARSVQMPKTRRPLPNVLPIDHVFTLLDTPAVAALVSTSARPGYSRIVLRYRHTRQRTRWTEYDRCRCIGWYPTRTRQGQTRTPGLFWRHRQESAARPISKPSSPPARIPWTRRFFSIIAGSG